MSPAFQCRPTGLDRRNFIKQVIVSAAATAALSDTSCLGSPAADATPARPNVLWMLAARDRIDETYDRVRCVRTKRLKYLRNFCPNQPYIQVNVVPKLVLPVLTLMEVLHEEGKLTAAQARFMVKTRPAEELYDLENDPHEIDNLATDGAYLAQLESMRAILEKWIVETDDHGRNREDPGVVENVRKDFRHRIHEPAMKQRGLDPSITAREYLRYWEERMLSDK